MTPAESASFGDTVLTCECGRCRDAARYLAERRASERMAHDGGSWLFTDAFGQVWRVRPTDLRDMPLTISLESRP